MLLQRHLCQKARISGSEKIRLQAKCRSTHGVPKLSVALSSTTSPSQLVLLSRPWVGRLCGVSVVRRSAGGGAESTSSRHSRLRGQARSPCEPGCSLGLFVLHEWSYAVFPQRLGTLEDEYGHRKLMYNAME